jgi:hypothetical protein
MASEEARRAHIVATHSFLCFEKKRKEKKPYIQCYEQQVASKQQGMLKKDQNADPPSFVLPSITSLASLIFEAR